MVTKTFFKDKKVGKFLKFIYNNFFSKLGWSYDHLDIMWSHPKLGMEKIHLTYFMCYILYSTNHNLQHYFFFPYKIINVIDIKEN